MMQRLFKSSRPAEPEEFNKVCTPEEEEEIRRIISCSDYFQVLEIDPNDDHSHLNKDEEVLRQSYLDKCLLLNPSTCSHPKLNEALKRLTEAYDVLSNPSERRQHRVKNYGLTEEEEAAEAAAADPFLQLLQAFLGFDSLARGSNDGPRIVRVPNGHAIMPGRGQNLLDLLFNGPRQVNGRRAMVEDHPDGDDGPTQDEPEEEIVDADEEEVRRRPVPQNVPQNPFAMLEQLLGAPNRRRVAQPTLGDLLFRSIARPGTRPGATVEDLEELYATQLAQLEAMGFTDRDRNLRALHRVDGDVDGAVELLVG